MNVLFVLPQVCLAFFGGSDMTLYLLKINSNENFVCTPLSKRDRLVASPKEVY